MRLTVGSLRILLIVSVLIFASASMASAQDTSVETSASVETNTGGQLPQKPRPLQLLHDVRANVKNTVLGEIRDMKIETRVDLKVATTGAEKRAVVQDARGEFKEVRSNVKERLQALFRTHLGSAIARLNAALRHFDNIVERIESRIEKLKGRGVDTTSVEASLATSVGLIAVAKADVQALSDLLSSVSPTSDPETVKAGVRAAIEKATASVKAAHRSLVDTAKQLAALVRASVEINSTTSDTSGGEGQ